MSNVDGPQQCDLAVVGAGAAGLATAIASTDQAHASGIFRVILLDGAKTIGAKILISGGGRCNVTHQEVTPGDFFGNHRIIKNILAAFPVEKTLSWFASLGVELKREETGKLFPVTDTSRTVLNALLERCRKSGVDDCSDHRVTGIEIAGGASPGFVLRHARGTIHAKKIVLATGGRSIPKSGSDGFGYELAQRLGHRVTTTVPALVPLILNDRMFHKTLSGLSQEVEITTIVNSRKVDNRTGSLLWTHFGISGPVVMDASRFWTRGREQGNSVEVYGNFMPGWTHEQVRQWFLEQTRENPRRSAARMLAKRLPQRFGDEVLHHIGCDGQKAGAQVSRREREQLLATLTKFPFPVEGDRGWNYAEVTAGGVPLEEIDFRTMESKLVPGLYLVGEILDCDGRIGGFNFQWAWATGWLAGRAVADRRSRAAGYGR